MYHNVRDVRFWHKSDVVQANVRYERKADINADSNHLSKMVSLAVFNESVV